MGSEHSQTAISVRAGDGEWQISDARRDRFPLGSVAGSASVSGKNLTGNDSATLTPQILPGGRVLTEPCVFACGKACDVHRVLQLLICLNL